ncbi:MAG: RIP metalloprotease RseP [Candidatus Omnitrophica bacterium]|nr:RIP metalloprotease RseP [Candidatus Omnitrophota bacterium]
MIGLLIFLFVLGVVIISHEFGHFIVAKKLGVRVEKFSFGFGKALWKKKKGHTEYAISSVPLGGYVKLAGDCLEEYKGNSDEYLSRPPEQRAAIVFFGPLFNYVLGFLCFWFIFFAGYPTLTTKVGTLLDDFGAKNAGIQAGDKIITIGGKKVFYWDDLQKEIQSNKNNKFLDISVIRADKEYNFKVEIKSKELGDSLGQKRSFGLIGITPADEIVKVRHGLIASFGLAASKTLDMTVTTYKALWYLVTGKLSMRESMTGPLGIFLITSKAAALGFTALLHLIAVLNISLAIFNLLPFPVLDGGHMVLLAIEKIRGKMISEKFERVMNQIGISLLLFLAVIVTYNDLMRIFGDKIIKLFK